MAQEYHPVSSEFAPDERMYAAVRERAAFIDRSREGRIGVAGRDRAEWLQGLLTNDVKAIAAGQGCYAAWLTPQGRMIADLRVLELGDEMLLDVPAGKVGELVGRLDAFIIMEDVRLRDRTGELARLSIYGADAAGSLSEAISGSEPHVTPPDLDTLAEHSSRATRWGGHDCIVAATRELGVPGYDVYVPKAARSELIAALRRARAAVLDEATWQALRIEAGRPLFGADMHEDTIPLEAGIESRAISLTKGCYVGQEVVIRILHRGQGRVVRRLMTLEAIEPGASLAAGDSLFAGAREVGRVTSAARSPSTGRVIALGYLHRDFAVAGSSVEALHGDRRVAVRATGLAS
jgi:tRNA-modifying protein YgfZ